MDSTQRKVIGLYGGFFLKLYAALRFLVCPFVRVESFVPKKGLVIDVGCGFGIFSLFMKLKGPKRRVVGCDLNVKRISVAQRIVSDAGISGVSFMAKKVEKLVLSKPDAVVMIDLLHHVPYDVQSALLKRVYSALRSGGVLIIKDLSETPRWRYFWNYLHDAVSTWSFDMFFIKKKGFVQLLEKTGFIVEIVDLSSIFIPYNHVLFIAKKK